MSTLTPWTGSPTFAITLDLMKHGEIIRSRVCDVRTVMGLRRCVSTALRVARSLGLPEELGAWHVCAWLPKAFVERWQLKVSRTRITQHGRTVCEGRTC